jgi:hypothetical protein
MMMRLLGGLVGFILGCLAAGLAMVLFVLTPAELAGLPPDVATDRMGKALELAVFVAVQAALFSAPLALVGAAGGEFLQNRNWTYYALIGLLIAGFGFYAQHSTEQIGQPTIANNYALTAFLTAGFVGGFVYWLVSGRHAGKRGGNSSARPGLQDSREGEKLDQTPPVARSTVETKPVVAPAEPPVVTSPPAAEPKSP